ncbi:DUF1515 family protein [Devosia nitrariae]|uniref:DUF1515 domain-containing protein n=1 Tax=Devosia nitrariae TaxID=2071872 RepID=A0ABQ5W5T7_9HYPH|nr:DUF1515 family protein [Devosia nitrariae]GLQ55434.1 hypothetical protein GCM10010862_26930 [Devosia nitrariae]
MAEDPFHEILRTLGRLEEGVRRQDENIEEGRKSRERIHLHLEKIEEDLGIVGQVAAQAREQTAATRKIVDEEIKPVTDDVKRMRMVGLGIAGLLGFAFSALGITLATVGEGVVQVVRSWLGISS